MCALFHHPLFSSGEKRQRELQLGCGCAGDDARLRGNNDVLRPSSLLCHRRDLCDCVRIPDYVKMNTGEDGITKSVVTLVGACLFLIGAFLVFPAFFGYRI